jgi:hypothetical protein
MSRRICSCADVCACGVGKDGGLIRGLVRVWEESGGVRKGSDDGNIVVLGRGVCVDGDGKAV